MSAQTHDTLRDHAARTCERSGSPYGISDRVLVRAASASRATLPSLVAALFFVAIAFGACALFAPAA